ncbi:hypothetical protein BHE97_15335 [Aeromicrobium sp. PE09-221]|uniref:hypothetical protein n=1 Tax=Aeromicrobium sp. PE09-221 TaxID=1898043 RepID=UPI000B3E50DA|nr:hypothetical protein [Aeromicrobium sp. PE09-221]OUZ07759.1 hypothetical protein BHE97_15335 [Aeromicrobium sp. PE09-221]
MTQDGRTLLVVVASVLTAFAVNLVLDATTEFPMLLRWVVAILASVLVTKVATARSAGSRD